MSFEELETLKNENDCLKQKNENLKNQLEKTCKQYLTLYNKIETTKDFICDLIKKRKYEINIETFTYISLEQLGDLKLILDKLDGKNEAK